MLILICLICNVQVGIAKELAIIGLMGAGSWGIKSSSENSGATPVHMTAWTKQKISICSPTVASSGTKNYTLSAIHRTSSFTSSCTIYKVDNDTENKEYFLIENRSKGGYDAGFYGLKDGSSVYSVGTGYSGVIIWHFQDILSSCLDNNTCQNGSTKLLDL